MIREPRDLAPEERKQHMHHWGGYNDYPPNWEEIDADTFWAQWGSYVYHLQEYRQMAHPDYVHLKTTASDKWPRGGPLLSARLFYFEYGTGLAVHVGYEYDPQIHGTRYPPRFFRFADCIHEWEAVPEKSGRMLHVSRCAKCGRERIIDSSG